MDLHDCQSMLEKAEDEIDRLRKSYADILQRQTDRFLNEKKENDRLRNLYKETCEEKNEEIFEWIEHSKQLVLISQQWQEENSRLRAILRWVVDTDPTVLRTADVHTDCKCHRCAMDAARTALGRDFEEKE